MGPMLGLFVVILGTFEEESAAINQLLKLEESGNNFFLFEFGKRVVERQAEQARGHVFRYRASARLTPEFLSHGGEMQR